MMRYFLNTVETIEEGVGFSYFGATHLFWLGFFIIFAIGCCYIYKVSDKERRLKLRKLLALRKYYAYGEQYDYFNDKNVVGFTRLGDYEHHDSGLAVVMSDARGGGIQMNVGKNLANTVFYDCTGNLSETVYVDNDGNGIFYCKDGSVSIWIKQGQSVN